MIAKNKLRGAGTGCLPRNSPLIKELKSLSFDDLNLDDAQDSRRFGRIWSIVEARLNTIKRSIESGFCLASPSHKRTDCHGCATAAPGHKQEDIMYEKDQLEQLKTQLRRIRDNYRLQLTS